MSQMVSAEFESVDLAELAARNVRYKFEGVSKIKIRYRAMEHDNYHFITPLVANNTYSNGYMDAYGAGALYYKEPNNETEESQTETLMIEAEAVSAKRIASYLRGLGGIKVKISDAE